jgi:glycerol-3-phosphate dehydrogenase subunit B
LKELHGVDAFAEDVSIPNLPMSAALTDLYGRRAPSLSKARGASVAYPPGFSALPDDSFELLAAPPSPHGWRLQQTIGLGSLQAEIDSFESEGGRITAARAGDRVFRADSIVLATGHHIGGGIRGGRKQSEPIAGLGIFHEGRPAIAGGARLRHLEYLDAAAEMHSGLMTDRQLHPLSEEGVAPYSNLFAAGAVLGGYEYAGPCGFGVPLLTGWLAGTFAAKKG